MIALRVIDKQIEVFEPVTVSVDCTPEYDDGRLTVAYAENDDEREYVFSVYRFEDSDTFEVPEGSKICNFTGDMAHVLTPIEAYEGDRT